MTVLYCGNRPSGSSGKRKQVEMGAVGRLYWRGGLHTRGIMWLIRRKRLTFFPKRCFALWLWFALRPPFHYELDIFWKDQATIEAH